MDYGSRGNFTIRGQDASDGLKLHTPSSHPDRTVISIRVFGRAAPGGNAAGVLKLI
jgi:hypothetical protein